MFVTACRFVPMFSSIAHKIVPRPRFIRVLDCDRILVVQSANSEVDDLAFACGRVSAEMHCSTVYSVDIKFDCRGVVAEM